MTPSPEARYVIYPDLLAEAAIPARGIHSQTLSANADVELTLFSMAAGEKLTEHTSARPAIVHVLKGSGELTVAKAIHPLAPGTWLRMAAGTGHAITAAEPIVFALYLLPRS